MTQPPEFDPLDILETLRGLEDFLPAERISQLKKCRTLMLNSDYTPISVLPLHTVDWKESITLVYQGKCSPVEMYEVAINSAHRAFYLPSILVNKRYIRPKRKVEYSRQNVFLRDGYQCQYCGQVFSASRLTIDHWVPRKEGGKTKFNNIVTACGPCNHRKQTQNRNRWKPRQEPYTPNFKELEAKARRKPLRIPDPKWIPYLGWIGEIIVDPNNASPGLLDYDDLEDQSI